MKAECGRKLFDAFSGTGRGCGMSSEAAADRPAVPDQQSAKAMERSLGSMIGHLLTLGEETWALYAWSREPLAGKFTIEQKLAYGRKAAECGAREAGFLLDALSLDSRLHSRIPSGHGDGKGMDYVNVRKQEDRTDIRKLAEDMGLKVSAPQIPNGGGHVIFAQYQEPDSITIFMDSAEKAEALIRKEGLGNLLGDRAVEDVLLAHELFHVVEYRKRDSIYTQTEKVELWRKPFSNRSRLICLGEIAGMTFARRLAGISYTPYVLDVLMMYGYDKRAATALYEEIVEFAGEGGGKER